MSVDILAIEVAQEMETSGDAFQAGIEYASEKQAVLQNDQMMLVDMDAGFVENLNLKELIRLNCHEYLPKDD